MSELELFLCEIDKKGQTTHTPSDKIALNAHLKSEQRPQRSVSNDATQLTSAPTVFHLETESFLQTDRKRPASSLNPSAKRGKTNPKVIRISDRSKLPKIKPILANNPNEFVKTVSLGRLSEIKQMRSGLIPQSTQSTQTTAPTESDALINSKSKYNWTVEEQQMSELEKKLESLEKQESKVNFKSTLTDIKVTLVTCTLCNYTAETALRNCMKRYHVLTRKRVVKSYFVCKKCDNVKSVYNSSYPKTQCGGCGSLQFIKSRLPIKTKTNADDLFVRGFEEQYLM